jgi:hypothetical protein
MYTADLSEEDRQLFEHAEKIYGDLADLGMTSKMIVAANLVTLALADCPDELAEPFCGGLFRRVGDMRRRREGVSLMQ